MSNKHPKSEEANHTCRPLVGCLLSCFCTVCGSALEQLLELRRSLGLGPVTSVVFSRRSYDSMIGSILDWALLLSSTPWQACPLCRWIRPSFGQLVGGLEGWKNNHVCDLWARGHQSAT